MFFSFMFLEICFLSKKKINSSPPPSHPQFLSATSPSHQNFVRLKRWKESISLHHQRGKNSVSVITLSRAIKPLPWSDRWQMLEGLFIFCLLIRAARRGGSAGEWGGRVRKSGGEEEGRDVGTIKETPCSSWRKQ